MKSSISISSVLEASALLLIGSLQFASAQQQTEVGCFSSSDPLVSQGSYTYQSNGYCLDLCYKAGYSVFGLYSGNVCLCGNKIPEKSTKVSDSQCNVPCAAWPIVMCGGDDAYSIYLTGLESNVAYYSPSTSTTTEESNTATKTTGSSDDKATTTTGGGGTSTTGGQTVYVTATSETETPTQQSTKKSGPNTAAIAAGVVVGVVGLCALIGAGFFLWRFKARHPADQRFRESNNVERFGKPMSQDSMSDSRFDGDFMAQRRQSNGSIDDDQDFSRRILQVTNPDRL